eukprot:1458717-Karenia_brevis.AAC.1
MAPCAIATSIQQYQYDVIVQPEGPPTTIEVVDKNGTTIPVNINLHEDADIRIDLIDQIRENENLPRVTWTEDVFHRKGVIPFGSMDDEGAVAAGSDMAESAGQASVV